MSNNPSVISFVREGLSDLDSLRRQGRNLLSALLMAGAVLPNVACVTASIEIAGSAISSTARIARVAIRNTDIIPLPGNAPAVVQHGVRMYQAGQQFVDRAAQAEQALAYGEEVVELVSQARSANDAVMSYAEAANYLQNIGFHPDDTQLILDAVEYFDAPIPMSWDEAQELVSAHDAVLRELAVAH